MPEGVVTSVTISDAYRYFAGQALLTTSQSRVTNKIFITNRYCAW